MKHKSDLRHASTAKAQAEDNEKKAREGLRVTEGELRVLGPSCAIRMHYYTGHVVRLLRLRAP